MEILQAAAVEVAQARWALAQDMDLHRYPEQEADARLLEWALGALPE